MIPMVQVVFFCSFLLFPCFTTTSLAFSTSTVSYTGVSSTSISLGVTTSLSSSSSFPNNLTKQHGPVQQKGDEIPHNLSSLLDDAVLLFHNAKVKDSKSSLSSSSSSVDISCEKEQDDLECVIEDIAFAIQHDKKKQRSSYHNDIIQLDTRIPVKNKRTNRKRTAEIRHELDEAIMSIQKQNIEISKQKQEGGIDNDKQHQLVHMVEQLAIEYHDIYKSNALPLQNDNGQDTAQELLLPAYQENDIDRIAHSQNSYSVEELRFKLDRVKLKLNAPFTENAEPHDHGISSKININHESPSKNEQKVKTLIESNDDSLISSKQRSIQKSITEKRNTHAFKQSSFKDSTTSTQSASHIPIPQNKKIEIIRESVRIPKYALSTLSPSKPVEEEGKTVTNTAFNLLTSNNNNIFISKKVASSNPITQRNAQMKRREHTSHTYAFKSSSSSSTISTAKRNTKLNGTVGDTNTISSLESRPEKEKAQENDLNNKEETENVEEVDIAIIGAGIGGLCAGSILNTLYGKKVGVYESHYLPGGCAHAFPITTMVDKVGEDGIMKKEKVKFTFDSGPTIVLGCSTKPYNPLRQVLNAVGMDDEVEWIPYQGWGMIEHPLKDEKEKRWRVELGPSLFENGPLTGFGGEDALREFQELRESTKELISGAVGIPAMAMRAGNSALIPLLRYLPALIGLIKQGEEVTQGTFGQFMDGPKFIVKNQWLRDWLDALAFSLSGLPASRTAAAAMAYVIYDMHREGAALDYPKGGLGAVIDALVKGVEQGSNGSRVHLRQHVENIDISADGNDIKGIILKGGKRVIAKDGVICNAPVWSVKNLIKNEEALKVLNDSLPLNKQRSPRQSWIVPGNDIRSSIRHERPIVDEDDNSSLLAKYDTAEMTGSFLHLHLALDANGLDLDSLEAHYTVMDRGLGGDNAMINGCKDGPCGELNMIAVSNPCVLDKTLAPDGYIVVHAYGAGNEPYDIWKNMKRNSPEYIALKEQRAQALWRAVESIIPDVRKRVVTSLIGSPITHERFLRRPKGTYGSATEDYLKDGSTPYKNLVLCGDGVFPGIGIPSVALSGASAANSMTSPWIHWKCLDNLWSKKLI